MYQVVFSKKAIKALSKIPSSYQLQIEKHVQILYSTPFKLDIKKLENSSKATHRLRVGNYRLFLKIDAVLKKIIIAEIERRTSQTYR